MWSAFDGESCLLPRPLSVFSLCSLVIFSCARLSFLSFLLPAASSPLSCARSRFFSCARLCVVEAFRREAASLITVDAPSTVNETMTNPSPRLSLSVPRWSLDGP
eukprot:scaffold1248_cov122-Isochrysis_galbana.AAC.13